jgi:hypothetical protein
MPTVAIASAVLRVVSVADLVLVHWAKVSESDNERKRLSRLWTYVESHQLWLPGGRTMRVRMACDRIRYPIYQH